MDYHLQNLRTREVIPLDPRRTLIGTAGHATIPIPDGPYLAALAVRYPTGWAIHGLSHDARVTYNRQPLHVAQQVTPKKGDLLVIGDERFGIISPSSEAPLPHAPKVDESPLACFATIRNPDGMEECRAVDHDLLFGRLADCHVQLDDSRLSRLAALLAFHGGEWFIHALSDKSIARNRKRVTPFSTLADGDELQIGPLFVAIEIRTDESSTITDLAGTTDIDDVPNPAPGVDLPALLAAGQGLEMWLKAHPPTAVPRTPGIGGWLGAQRDRLMRFWNDTPETTTARALRTAGKPEEAFTILDRAIRARSDSPELLRELYRLYDAVGLTELGYRPLRQIEKLASAKGVPDPWVLETLARLCERLARKRPQFFDRAINYWNKLEAATGISYARERTAAMATRTLHDGRYEDKLDEGD